jgi:hypothetical protein
MEHSHCGGIQKEGKRRWEELKKNGGTVVILVKRTAEVIGLAGPNEWGAVLCRLFQILKRLTIRNPLHYLHKPPWGFVNIMKIAMRIRNGCCVFYHRSNSAVDTQ